MGYSQKDQVGNFGDNQDRLVVLFLVVSCFFHTGVLIFSKFDLLTDREPLVQEWVVETDLVIDAGSNAVGGQISLPRSVKSDEILVPSNLLPQLPKRYEVEKETVKKSVGDTKVKDERKSAAKDEKGEKVDAPDSLDKVKKLKLKEIQKRKALEKLLSEQKKKSKDYQAPAKDPLKKIAEAYQKRTAGKGDKSAVIAGGKAEDLYIQRLTEAVRASYFLPETYRYKKREIAPVLAIRLDRTGGLMSVKIEKTSDDEMFDNFIVKAFKEAAPFRPPPKSLVGRTFHFVYRP